MMNNRINLFLNNNVKKINRLIRRVFFILHFIIAAQLTAQAGQPYPKSNSKYDYAVTKAENTICSAIRLQCTEKQIKSAKDALEKVKEDLIAFEHALLAKDIYHERSKMVLGGWRRLSHTELLRLGLNPPDFKNLGSEFRAGLYHHPEKKRYALVFKGTSAWEDWLNNLSQKIPYFKLIELIDKTPVNQTAYPVLLFILKASPFLVPFDYHKKAVNLALSVKTALKDKLEKKGIILTVCGHSLGGGLAYTASRTRNIKGYTFNPAHVNDETLGKFYLQHKEDIEAYVVKQELVSMLESMSTKTYNSVRGHLHLLEAYDEQLRPLDEKKQAITYLKAQFSVHSNLTRLAAGTEFYYLSYIKHKQKTVIYGIKKLLLNKLSVLGKKLAPLNQEIAVQKALFQRQREKLLKEWHDIRKKRLEIDDQLLSVKKIILKRKEGSGRLIISPKELKLIDEAKKKRNMLFTRESKCLAELKKINTIIENRPARNEKPFKTDILLPKDWNEKPKTFSYHMVRHRKLC